MFILLLQSHRIMHVMYVSVSFRKSTRLFSCLAPSGVLFIFPVTVLPFLDDLCLMLSEMEVVVTSRIVIGCDLNVSLAPNLEGLTGSRIHPNANGVSTRWREAVTEWMQSLRLRAACTFDYEKTDWRSVWDYEEKWTHENSFKSGKYQLDYLLVSNYFRGEASVVRGYDLGSDHRPIDANLRLEHKENGVLPNAWSFHRKDGIQELRKQS